MLPPLESLRLEADALILDIDGTLLDSMTIWNQADVVFLSKRGFEVTPDYTDYVKSVRIEDAALYTKERYNLPDSIEEIMAEWNSFVENAYANEVKLKPGVMKFLMEARSLGFKMGCATALTFRNVDAAFKRLGLYEYLDVLLTLDDLPGRPDKSEPDIYFEVASRLNADASKTVVFEDVPIAIEGALKGGFITCAIYDEVGAGSIKSWEEMTLKSKYSLKAWDGRQ
ncbi:MAG: HAD family phosphatase [Saccharofermentans sp.]|nr:HAD family phosphatase [Saccharofermentans sp.]